MGRVGGLDREGRVCQAALERLQVSFTGRPGLVEGGPLVAGGRQCVTGLVDRGCRFGQPSCRHLNGGLEPKQTLPHVATGGRRAGQSLAGGCGVFVGAGSGSPAISHTLVERGECLSRVPGCKLGGGDLAGCGPGIPDCASDPLGSPVAFGFEFVLPHAL